MNSISDRCRQAREALGLTQAQLARAAGVRQSAIGNLESGIRIRPRKLLEIAVALGVNATWLQDGTPPMKPGESLGVSEPEKSYGTADIKELHPPRNHAWPFQRIDPEAFTELSPSDLDFLEGIIAAHLAHLSRQAKRRVKP